jgi:hypothetical protein
LQQWENNWLMRFNPDKCEVFIATNKKSPIHSEYTIYGQVLNQTDSAKYLGLNIHKSLSWDSHIDKITKKANSTLAFLWRNVSRCPNTIKAVLHRLSTTYPRICIQHMEPQQKRQHQQGWGSITSSRQVCHWRLPAHKQCHSHTTATPVADTTKQTNICLDSDDVPHSVQPCWYTSGTPLQPHLPSNQRPFTTIPGTTHKNYSVQDIILPTSHTPLEPTTWMCGGSRHSRQLQGSAV